MKYRRMQRRRFLATTGALALGAPLAPLFGRPFQGIGEVHLIRERVGYYTDRGGTIGFYRPDGGVGGVVVDSQFPEQATTFVREVFDAYKELDLLINTHHHGDHTGGNGVVAPMARAYVSHERARQNLSDSESRKTDATTAVPLPDTTFTDRWSLALPDGRETVTARHFGPAHTGGDAVIHFENANVAHVGDLVFNRRFPYIDPASGGNMTHWIKVLGDIRKAYDRDTVFLFGHAAESYPVAGDRDDLRAFENYLRALRTYVKREKRKGTTLEALKQKTTTIPNAPEWRSGERLRDLNLEVMYAEV